MAKLNYSQKRLDECIFSVDDSMNSPDDLISSYGIEESQIEKAWEELTVGKSLLGGSPTCRIRMLDVWKWEFIVDPPVDDNYDPLWEEASQEYIEYITSGDDLCSLLLIFAAENGDPTKFITEKWRYRP